MKVQPIFFVTVLALSGALLAGCEPSVPENPKPADGTNPHVSGSPEERIKRIEADSTLSPEERARRIQVVKERNHIK